MKEKPRILCVDDDSLILNYLKRTLTRSGHDVEIAFSCEDALRFLEGDGQDFGLLISDYRMPFTDGLTLFQTVRKRWPHIRRLLASGKRTYSDFEDAVTNGLLHGFLPKPFLDSSLQTEVARLLASPDPA